MLDDRQIAALRIGVVEVEIAAHHELALVGLADVEVHGARRDDGVEHRLDGLGHHRLQHVRLDGKLQSRHRGDVAGMPGDGEPELRRRDEALRGVDTRDGAVVDPDPGHGALLDDVDAAGVRRTRIAPSHGVVADRAPARLQEAAQDREARFRRAIEVGDPPRDVVARQELRVDAVEPHRVAAAHRRIDVGRRVDEIQHAARAVHHVEVEVLRELLPQLERELVEMRVGVEVVVRAHDRRIAPGVAAAEPALFEHCDVGEAVLLREVVRGREPVSAAADDDRVVARFWRRTAPRKRPALVVAPRVARQREDRVFQRSLCRPCRRYGCRRRTGSLILMAPRHARG